MIRCRYILWMVVVVWVSAWAAQPVPISSIEFQGNESIDAVHLKARLHVSREGNWYSPEALKLELQEVEKLYQDSGFLKARVGPPRIEYRKSEGRGPGVAILIPVEEGPMYRLGRLSIEGADVSDPETFIQMSPLRAGQTYSRRLVSEWLDKIKLSYNEIGYIRFDAQVREQPHESERTVDCVLEFTEGSPYRVGRITVTSDAVDPVEFRKQLLVGEGGLYNPEMLAYTIQYLNLRRIYRPFGPSDVEVRIDDTAHKVDLVFHVVPLRKPSSGLQDAVDCSGRVGRG
jgi:outer membrane protein insertion porin family